MSALVSTIPHSGGAMVAQRDMEAVRNAMKTSLYPGATDDSVDMVLAYCRASGLDPMTKPVHIVPMSVTTGKDSRGFAIKEMRDVVMPGIGLYRINAARTGAYAGCSDPEFGPIRTMAVTKDVWSDGPNGKRQKRTVDGGEFSYPEWCRITVTRIVDGVAREFSATEYWIENYATAGGDSDAPNAMWKKRPFGQLAKCTEAQALRKAFPEAVGSQPTADEMEGKHFIEGEVVRMDSSASDGGVSMPKAKAKPLIESTASEPAPETSRRAKPEQAAEDRAEPEAKAEAAPGLDLADGPRRILMMKAKQAGFLSEDSLLAKFPSINKVNLNDVLAELRKIQDANDGAA